LQVKEKELKHRKGKKFVRYTDKQKLTALQVYQATGSIKQAALDAGIGYEYLRQITTTDWWKKSVQEFQEASDNQLDSEMTDIIHTGVLALKDRVSNGDYMWDSASQMFKRKHLPAKDLVKVTEMLMKQRSAHREKPAEQATQASIQDHLSRIANALVNNFGNKPQVVSDIDFIIKDNPNDNTTMLALPTTPYQANAAAFTHEIESDNGDKA
jgi:GTPase involved in cell partitioning and DNA repair